MLTGCSNLFDVKKENIENTPVIYETLDNDNKIYNIKLLDKDEINIEQEIYNIINFSDKTKTLFYEDIDVNINKYKEGKVEKINIEYPILYNKEISFNNDHSLVIYDLTYSQDVYSDMKVEEYNLFSKYIMINPIYLENTNGFKKISENAKLISITDDNEIIFLESDNEINKDTLYMYTNDNKKIIIDSGKKIEWAKWNNKFKKLIYGKNEDINKLYVWDFKDGICKIDEGKNILSEFKENKVNMIDENHIAYIKYNGNAFTLNIGDIKGNVEEIESNVDSIGIHDTRESIGEYLYYVPKASFENKLLCYDVKNRQIEEISSNFKSGKVYDDRVIFIENDESLYEKMHDNSDINKVSDHIDIDSNISGNEFLYLNISCYLYGCYTL